MIVSWEEMLENRQPEVVLDAESLGARVTYHPAYLGQAEADTLFAWMMTNTPWQAETPMVFGKTHEIRRRTCSYGSAGLVYRYSGLDRVALPWPDQMLPLLNRLREEFRAPFNFGLCNFYPDGDAYIGKHSDDERDIVRDSPIIGLSLGAAREFVFYRRGGARVAEVALEHGSVVAMLGSTQRHFHHTVPKRKRVLEPRINVTFRVLSGAR
jgi:alkylated DNA repair dioxygenase AlkB